VRADAARGAVLSRADAFAVLVAALGHDVGHPGYTGAFEETLGRPHANLVGAPGGAGAALERFHAHVLVQLLDDAAAGTDALAELDAGAAAGARRTVVAAVLATDMAQHDACVADLGARARARAPWADAGARAALACAVVHTADLSGAAFPARVAQNWAARIVAEFAAQAAAEAARGLPLTPYMQGLHAPRAQARLQVGFYGNVVLPLWRGLAATLPGLEEPVANVEAALEGCRRAAEEGDKSG